VKKKRATEFVVCHWISDVGSSVFFFFFFF